MNGPTRRARLVLFVLAPLVFPSPLFAAAARAPVRIHISAPTGEPVPNAYAALVPAWRSWSSPLAEGMAESGAITFSVPKGTYHLVCGAKGFQFATEGPYTFADALGGNFDVFLKPLVRVSGKVTDEQDRPLAGVRVAESRGAIAPPFGNVSPLAFTQLSSGWSTVTDEAGNWTLGLSEGKVPLLFAKDGRVAQWRLCKTGDPQPFNVSMPAAGATLKIACDRFDSNLVVTLEREGSDPLDSVPRTWQRQVWAQPAKQTSLTWQSLPPGVYSVYAKYADPAFFMRRAKKIDKVALSAGETVTRTVTLPDARRAASSVLRLFLESSSAQEIDVEDLGAHALDGNAGVARVPAVVEQAIGGVVLHVDLQAPFRPPVYVVTADQFIYGAADAPDLAASNEPPIAARLYRRADAHLSLRFAEKGISPPPRGTAVLRNCMKTPRIEVPVEMHDGNLAQFTAPADCKTSTLAFNPFEPLLLTKPLRPGEQSLGEFLLHAAASADVRVVRDPGGTPVSGAVVSISAPADDTSARQRVLAAEVETGADGWAHVEAIPVLRELQVIAQAPGGDLSVAMDAHAEPRGRVLIDPLSIPKPAALVISAKIKPALRALFPAAQIRSVAVEPVDSRRAELERRQSVPRGDAPIQFEPLQPGKWRIAAVVGVAGSYVLMKVDKVDLRPGEARSVGAELGPLVFQGRVTRAGKGIAARVTVDRQSAADVARQHFDSEKDGSFYALLPDTGAYETSVVPLDAQSDEIPVGQVQFDDPSRPVEIVLPATATVIVHVRSDGQPLAAVDVTASLTTNQSGTVEQNWRGRATDAHGDVKFENLVPAEWVFSANDSNGGTATKAAALHGSGQTEVLLDIERTNSVRGVVRYPSGVPAQHVRVDCLYVPPTSAVPARSSADTDIDGKFAVDTYSKSPLPVLCSAIAPTGIVAAFKATAGEPVVVQLPAATATLRIKDWARFYNPEAFWLVAADGSAVRVASVADIVGHSGELLQIPAVAAGRWRVVRVQSIPQWVALVVGQAAALPTVADIDLEPGAAETVHVYESPAPERRD